MAGYANKLKLIIEDLTYSEEMLADYIDSHRSEIQNLTSKELSDIVGVSQSTVIRFSQKLGYGSYKKMVSDFNNIDSSNSNNSNFEPQDDIATTNKKIRSQYDTVIDLTYEMNPPSSIQKTIDMISSAKCILIAAYSEKNVYFSNYFAHRLSFAGFNAFSCPNTTSEYAHLNMCNPGDTIVLISESGETPQILNYAKIARKKKMNVIAITRKNKNSLQSIADVALQVINYGDRGFVMMSMVRMSMLVLFDMILLNVIKKDYDDREKFSELIKLETKLNYIEK